jgi:KaiC/GvpD/RAD55 family RecA-like ATPase
MTIPTAPLDESRLQDNCISTGINVLDTENLQGIPEGSTVAILGDPLGMAELLLDHLVHTDRQTHYVSTVRPAESIRENLEKMGDVDDDALNIEDIYSSSKGGTSIMKKHAARVAPGHNFIVNSFTNAYDRDDPEQLIQTLRNIYQYVNNNDALAYIYYANTNIDHLSRAERESLTMCDAVFRVATDRDGDNIDTKLEVLRMRGRDFPDEEISLNVGRKITVDTTRDIA